MGARLGQNPFGSRLGQGGGSSSSGAPTDAQYLVLAAHADLTVERVATAGTGIAFADAGAGGALTISAKLSTGVAGGQSAIGGTAASESLTLSSTSHATKGDILFGTSAYKEATNRLGIATTGPLTPLHVVGEILGTTKLTVGSTAVGALGVTLEIGSTTATDTWLAINSAVANYGQLLIYSAGTLRWDLGRIATETAFRLREGSNTTTKIYADIGTEGVLRIAESGGNVLIGTTTEIATTKLRMDVSRSVASAAGAIWDAFDTMGTLTISGSTAITTATGVNMAVFDAPTLSAASALTVTNAATVYIGGAPVGGGAGPATITNALALWVDAGSVRFDGRILGSTATAATGTTMTLGASNYNTTTGSTTVDFITTTGWTAGSWIVLNLGADVTFRHNIASPPANTAALNLAGDANISPTQGDQLSFVYTGTVWQQTTAVLAS